MVSPDGSRRRNKFSGKSSGVDMATAVVSGRSTLICAEPTIAGTVIMKTIKSTNTTSTNGTTLMSLSAESSSSPKPD